MSPSTTFESTCEQEAYAEEMALDYASVEVRRLQREQVVSVIGRSEDGKATRIDLVRPDGTAMTLSEQQTYRDPDRVEGARLAISEDGDLDALRAFAARVFHAFPQYDGSFDAAELAELQREVRCKSGSLLVGDWVLYLGASDLDEDFGTGIRHARVLDLRTLSIVHIPARYVRVLVSPPGTLHEYQPPEGDR